MIAALFALAAAMAIGGAAAVIQGFPYVRLESGLALVIAGSVAASSGAVLFGLGVVASGLRRMERSAARGALRAEAPVEPAPAGDGRPRLPPVLPAAPAFVVPPMAEPPAREPLPAGRPRIEPDLHAAGTGAAAFAEPELPIPGLTPAPPSVAAPEPPEPAEPVQGIAPEDDLFAAPEATPKQDGAADGLPSLRPSLDAAPDPEPVPVTKAERTIVGRYASGGNTYVMFEDGSIEADTPQGRFTFNSLDELKAFVDGGGESSTRGAA